MKKFGLIGHPIAHSLSPALFEAGYGGRYPYDLIETADFEDGYSRFLAGYDGINVTAPFKEAALQKADIISDECRATGATNLLIRTPEGIKAYNSDYRGILLWLSSVSSQFMQQEKVHVLIVGYGGAGKAAAAAAETAGMDVTILNRTSKNSKIRPLEEFSKEFREADIIIYNLPVRIPALDIMTEDDCTPGKRKVILEANYRSPAFDKSLLNKITGWNPLITYEAGETWLLMQAITGYELFTGEKPDSAKMSSVIKSK